MTTCTYIYYVVAQHCTSICTNITWLLNTEHQHAPILCGCSTLNICMHPYNVVVQHWTSACTHIMWLHDTEHLRAPILCDCFTLTICLHPHYVVLNTEHLHVPTLCKGHDMSICLIPTLRDFLRLSSCTYANCTITKHCAAAHMQITPSLNTEQLHIHKLHHI